MARHGDILRALRRESGAVLAALGLGATFTLSELHTAVEQRQARPVHLLPKVLPADAPCGMWISGERAEYVFYDSTTSPVHQHAIVGHEFGHMLLDDGSTAAEVTEVAAMLLPNIDPKVLTGLLARTRYEEHRERRAEVFASVMVQRLGGWSNSPLPRAADPAVLARLVAALEAPS